MKKEFSVFVQNLTYYNEGKIVGGWLELQQEPEAIEKYLKDIVKVDDEHEEYEVADIENFDFEYKVVQWENLGKINNLAIIYSMLNETQKEAVLGYYNNIDNNLSINEIINICIQADKIPYYNYYFEGMSNFYDISNDEKIGRTMAEVNGVYDILEKNKVEDFFDFERYGEQFSYNYELLENGYIEYTDEVNKNLYSDEEIELRIKSILKEEKIINKMKLISEKFKYDTKNNEDLQKVFKDTRNKDVYYHIKVAGAILAGIDVRNLQRENGNLEGELEHSPFSKEQEKMIEEYTKLQNELEKEQQEMEIDIEI